MKRAAQVALVAAGLLGLAAVGWWAANTADEPRAGMRKAVGDARSSTTRASEALAGATAPPMAATPDPFLNAELRHKLELVLLEAGSAATPAELKRRLAAIVARHFAAGEAVRAAQLLERFVDYRVALGELKPPKDRTDPRALRQTFEARRQVRERHFQVDEAQALFAAEDELDRFTLARLEVLRNDALTPAQKEAAVRDAERDLGEPQRLARQQSVQHEAVAAQTAALDAAGANEQERYQARRAQYGDAAALQLAQLDREERDWQGRLSQYAAQRAAGNAPELEALRERLFTPQEQMRIDAALALRELTRK